MFWITQKWCRIWNPRIDILSGYSVPYEITCADFHFRVRFACPNEKCLAIKHDETLFYRQTFSLFETMSDRVVRSCLLKLKDYVKACEKLCSLNHVWDRLATDTVTASTCRFSGFVRIISLYLCADVL